GGDSTKRNREVVQIAARSDGAVRRPHLKLASEERVYLEWSRGAGSVVRFHLELGCENEQRHRATALARWAHANQGKREGPALAVLDRQGSAPAIRDDGACVRPLHVHGIRPGPDRNRPRGPLSAIRSRYRRQADQNRWEPSGR